MNFRLLSILLLLAACHQQQAAQTPAASQAPKQPAPAAATHNPQRRVIGQDFGQKQPAQDFDGFHIGQNVRHEKFGTGVIIDAVRRNNSARLTINFGKQGIKELDTAFAKLEKR